MKLNKKGFTLVELLAVIIILAIVVGLTIPAVLTTISSTRTKAFHTATDAAADWFERQYQAYQVGDNSIATVNQAFTNLCTSANNYCQVEQDLTTEAIVAAGLKTADIASGKVKINANGRACVTLNSKSDGAYQTQTEYSGGGGC